jgi:hypothetical protein
MQEQTDRPTGWVGWIFFAGFMMIVVGALNLIYGLVALFNDDWVVWGNRGAVLLDITAWGWVHALLGAVVVLAGIGVLLGNLAARTVAVIVVGISLVANFAAIPVYPAWSIVAIAIELLVLWALIVHGRELKT